VLRLVIVIEIAPTKVKVF